MLGRGETGIGDGEACDRKSREFWLRFFRFSSQESPQVPDSRSWKLATLARIAQDIGSPVLVVENPVFWVWRMGNGLLTLWILPTF
ncbi:hypothetical protein LAY57_17265 [Argonema antarcticum A004/B2]|nr:hypothetical protein [Argonema antarcticum A004/B2]